MNIAVYTEKICRLTHTDSRCVGSCVIVSELIHHLVCMRKELAFDEIVNIGRKYDKRIEPICYWPRKKKLKIWPWIMRLWGITLKTLSAAIWCLYHVNNFKKDLLIVVNAGGGCGCQCGSGM